MSPKYAKKLLADFARAIKAKAFEGTIPWDSEDPREAAELLAIHEAIDAELYRTKNLLLKHLVGDNK